MKAITIHEFAGPEALQVEDVEKPEPGPNEVLVEVYASSLNPVDRKAISRDSDYKSAMHLPATPGWDLAGVIEKIGRDVKNIQPGDRVFGQASVLHKGTGAFAEYAVTRADSVAAMPDNLSFTEAASVPLAGASAYEAVVHHMNLQAGQHVLIHGGSGGIGSFAVQFAKYRGAHVTATASGDGVAFVKNLGADEVIDYERDFFEDKIRGFDAVLDTVGGDIYSKSFMVLKRGGILVSMLEAPDRSLMDRFGVNAVLETTVVNRKILSEIASLIEEEVLRVNVARTFSLDDAKDAYRAKETEKILGKIAIEIKR